MPCYIKDPKRDHNFDNHPYDSIALMEIRGHDIGNYRGPGAESQDDKLIHGRTMSTMVTTAATADHDLNHNWELPQMRGPNIDPK